MIVPDVYAAACGVTPAQYCAPCAVSAEIEAEPPTLTVVARPPSGSSPPAQRAHGGSSHFSFVTTVWIFLIAIGFTEFGTYPTAVIVRSFTAGPFVTVTLNWPRPTLKNVLPSYGASAVGGFAITI